LRSEQRLAGIVALSTYLIGGDGTVAEASAANRDVPIFMAHGTYDQVVHLPWAEQSRDTLVAGGWPVDGTSIRSNIRRPPRRSPRRDRSSPARCRYSNKTRRYSRLPEKARADARIEWTLNTFPKQLNKNTLKVTEPWISD
jgi:hypothetical protein